MITILWLRLWSQALWSQSAECNSSFYVQSRRHPIITVIIGFPSIRDSGRCHKKVSKISSMTYIWFHGAHCHLTDVTMCYQVTKWHVYSQSCDNLDMTRDFHPSLAKLSPQSLLKHPWTIKKGKAPDILEKPYFCPLFYFCWWERMCGGNWIGLIGACLTFSWCHIFYIHLIWNNSIKQKALKYIKSGDCRRRELKIRLFPVEIFRMKKIGLKERH